jgi:hypothetical protein
MIFSYFERYCSLRDSGLGPHCITRPWKLRNFTQLCDGSLRLSIHFTSAVTDAYVLNFNCSPRPLMVEKNLSEIFALSTTHYNSQMYIAH